MSKRAFCRFIPCCGTDIYKSNLTTSESNDTWDNPLKEFDGGTNPSVSVCPRSFGNERVFFHAGSDIIDNLSGKFEQARDDGLYPQVTVERPKKDNLFLIHREGLETKVDIYQIAP